MKNKYSEIQNTKANLDADPANWLTRPLAFPGRTIRLATSFSGIGAIEHAFHRLGLNVQLQFAGDIDPDCKRAYLANYPLDESRWHDDITTFDAKPFKGQVDLFVGGAPCQAFSMRGKRGGFEDTRGTLFREFARVVIECQPKVFIFENVKGMLNHDRGRTWNVIKRTFEQDCGYQVYFQVLNSKDYGVPQSRERIYCIGFKSPEDFKYPAPIPLTQTKFDYLDRHIPSNLFLKQKGCNFVTRSINYEKSYTQVNGNVALCQKRNQQFNWHGDFVFHPLAKNETVDPTDQTVYPVSAFEESYYIDSHISRYVLKKESDGLYEMTGAKTCNPSYGRYRKLSPRECLRLMGFDDTFNIAVTDTAAYKQSGNSIVVDVLMAILKQMDITKYGIDG
ncbi:MAG: DNA cytosine methyltransferase [Bacteroidales bacterium]|nr:DNA cytosine methyltransferase [Bacteroidales bacterium]